MSKNTNLSFLTDYITADITNGRIGINNASPAFAFDVTGANRFVGTTASDTAPLGSELAGVTGTGTNWALAGGATNLNVGGYVHTVGDVTPLTTSLSAVNGTYYQITYTITGRTAGSIVINYGGISRSASSSGSIAPKAISTAVLTITPTNDFDGTVVLSIKSIGTRSASSTFANSSGISNIEVRASNITSNTFIGLNAGSRNTIATGNSFYGTNAGTNNTGGSNTFIGNGAGQFNITSNENVAVGNDALTNGGGRCTAVGVLALLNNTAGNNDAFGFFALQANTTGGANAAFGNFALYLNTTGNNNTGVGQGALQVNVTGSFNTAIGNVAMNNLTSGNNNIAIGQAAGRLIADGTTANTISDNSIYIGTSTKALANSQTNQIVIGTNSTGLGSNTTVLGNSSTLTTAIYGNLSLGSTVDAGYKLDVTGTARVSGAATFSNLITVSGFGNSTFSSAGTGYNKLTIRNTSAGTGNGAQLSIGTNADADQFYVQSFATTFTTSGMNIAGGAVVNGEGPGGLSIAATQSNIGFYTNGAGAANLRMTITSAGNVGIGSTNPSAKLLVFDSAGTTTNTLLVESVAQTSGHTGYFYSNSAQSGNTLRVYQDGAGSTGPALYVYSDGTYGAVFEKGVVLFGTTNATGNSTGSSVNVGVTIGGGVTSSQVNNNANHYWSKASGFTSGDLTAHFVNGVYVGGISTNGSTTNYAVASDYRLKEDLKDFVGIDLINRIKTYDYQWKSDKTRMYGVVAHEFSEVLSYAVIGEKDEERMQGVDYSKIVPVLVKAIQELSAEITILKNK